MPRPTSNVIDLFSHSASSAVAATARNARLHRLCRVAMPIGLAVAFGASLFFGIKVMEHPAGLLDGQLSLPLTAGAVMFLGMATAMTAAVKEGDFAPAPVRAPVPKSGARILHLPPRR